jgi:hypothetical protein
MSNGDKIEQTIPLKPLQVNRLMGLTQQAQATQSLALAYTQSIADAHNIEGFVDTRLDVEKLTLTFRFKDIEE